MYFVYYDFFKLLNQREFFSALITYKKLHIKKSFFPLHFFFLFCMSMLLFCRVLLGAMGLYNFSSLSLYLEKIYIYSYTNRQARVRHYFFFFLFLILKCKCSALPFECVIIPVQVFFQTGKYNLLWSCWRCRECVVILCRYS